MSFSPTTGDRLLSAWLSLTSTLWNKRLVSDLTYNEAHVMGILLRKKSSGAPCTATMLIQYTRLLKSQMTTLENKGYITRTRSSEDKRVIFIALTESGEAAYLAEHAHVEAIVSQLIAQIGEDKAQALTQGITETVAALENILESSE